MQSISCNYGIKLVKDRLYIFDTTLRDGAQTQGGDFSLDDKEKISEAIKDELGL